jgi:hypothetical protein
MESRAVNLNFLPRRVVWAPDCSSFLATSFGNDLQIFSENSAEYQQTLGLKCPGMVASAVWYPHMCQTDPASCALATVTAFNPVQLLDSVDGYHIAASMEATARLRFRASVPIRDAE